jgi:hypothetical protein
MRLDQYHQGGLIISRETLNMYEYLYHNKTPAMITRQESSFPSGRTERFNIFTIFIQVYTINLTHSILCDANNH